MNSILFVVPKMNGPNGDFTYNSSWNAELSNKINKNRWQVITPSVLLLSAIAKNEGFEVKIIDEEFRNLNLNLIYDIVCLYTVTPNSIRAYTIADHYRELGSYIVIGGVHSLFMQQEAKSHCDTLMLGEGEYIFKQFLSDFLLGKVKEQYSQGAGTVDLKDSPIPLYEILNKEEQKLVPMQTARGCSHSCKFCNVKSLYGNRFRYKSHEQIINELMEISKLPYTKKIYVTDDNIYSSYAHFKCLISCLQNSLLQWYANADISFAMHESDIKSAYKSGLRQILIGFESVDKSKLYQLDKDNFKYKYYSRYKEYIHKIQSNGIGVVGSFIAGNMNDTEDTFKYLEEFIYETKLYGASVTMATPYPGTVFFEEMRNNNKILSYNWDEYTIFQPLIKGEHLSVVRLNELYIQLLNKINSNEYMINKVKYFTNVYKELKV